MAFACPDTNEALAIDSETIPPHLAKAVEFYIQKTSDIDVSIQKTSAWKRFDESYHKWKLQRSTFAKTQNEYKQRNAYLLQEFASKQCQMTELMITITALKSSIDNQSKNLDSAQRTLMQSENEFMHLADYIKPCEKGDLCSTVDAKGVSTCPYLHSSSSLEIIHERESTIINTALELKRQEAEKEQCVVDETFYENRYVQLGTSLLINFNTFLPEELMDLIRSFCCTRSKKFGPYNGELIKRSAATFPLFNCQISRDCENGLAPYFLDDPVHLASKFRDVVPNCARCAKQCVSTNHVLWWNHTAKRFNTNLAYGYYTCTAVRLHTECADEWLLKFDNKTRLRIDETISMFKPVGEIPTIYRRVSPVNLEKVEPLAVNPHDPMTKIDLPEKDRIYFDPVCEFFCDERDCYYRSEEDGKSRISLFCLKLKCGNPETANIFKCSCQRLKNCHCGVIAWTSPDYY